jgi:dephospho-CoA kinase
MGHSERKRPNGTRMNPDYFRGERDISGAFPMAYGGMRQLEELRGNDRRILLGVTGGIASGKPGKPAWKDIVSFFGEQVLLPDQTLDRKKLSEIVFRDMEKRKKLEGFTHPRIHGEFVRLVKEHTAGNPAAIIQVVIPLLIEVNLQYLFHKLLLVYIPHESQIQRLMERDRISREMAQSILAAQLPIDEKRAYADYIIDNSGSLEETKKQVEEVWQKLKEFQKNRREERGGDYH